jgi:NitT/TauT family transport system substrate-binding protein
VTGLCLLTVGLRSIEGANMLGFVRSIVCVTLAAGALMFSVSPAHAEVKEIRIARGFGITVMPIMVMEHFKLIEKHARSLGIEARPLFVTQSAGTSHNDALLAGQLDIATTSPAPFLVLWDRTRDKPRGVLAVAGVSVMSNWLLTRNPAVKSIHDFTGKDRIAMPSLQVGHQATLLRMAAAKAFGADHFKKLDPLTVQLPHPAAAQAMLSGAGGIDSHFASPPYMFIEARDPAIHRVLDSVEVTGGPATFVIAIATRDFHDKNPKLYRAFLDALQEAVAFIGNHKKEAAQIYLRMAHDKSSVDSLVAILNNPEVEFTLVPKKTMLFADFLYRTGVIKHQPHSWKDLFFPEVHGLAGG